MDKLLIDETGEFYDIETTTIRHVYWNWKPQPDITAYELALCIPVFVTGWNIEPLISDLPPEARRHFEQVGE